MMENIKSFLSSTQLSNYLYIIFVSLGIVLCVLVSIWVIMEILQISSSRKSDTSILQPILVDNDNTVENIQTEDPAIIAAIIAAISSAKNIPGYNLRIKSFKRSGSNKW